MPAKCATMDDDVHTTVPLTASASPPSPTPQPAAAHSLRWYHYIFLLLLLLALIIGLLISLATPVTLISTVSILPVSIFAARTFLTRHRPPSVPIPFLITQAILSAFVAPIQVLFIVLPLVVITAICVAVMVLLISNMFASLHPHVNWDLLSNHRETLVSHFSQFLSLHGLWSSALVTLHETQLISVHESTAARRNLIDVISSAGGINI